MTEAKKNEVAVQGGGLTVPQVETSAEINTSEESFALIAKKKGYLPFINICAANSAMIAKKQAEGGHVVLKNGKDITDLGESISGLVLGWRPRAIDFDGDLGNSYDPNSEVWGKIQDKADQQGQTGASYGPEFLLWSGSIQPGGFALYMLGSDSARREAPSMRAILKEWKDGKAPLPAFTLGSRYNEGKKFNWYIPVITVCSTPIEPMPGDDDILAQTEAFLNPPKDERELVDDKDEGGRER